MATTYDKASLVMLPSGYKDTKLFSIKPTDGSGDFTFSRDGAGASPATRVNASGLIEKGRENLITYSNDFSNAAWTKNTASVTGGQSGYDGTNNAWRLESTGAGNPQIIQTTSNTLMKAHSIYAKAGNVSILRIWVGVTKEFDLSAGTTSSTNCKITDVGGGWYRCEVFDVFSNLNPFFPATASGEYIYIQDAQLEQGLIATDVITTTTAPVSAGLLGDMPRLDYSGGATCPSLLLEPSRVNLFEGSEYFGISQWQKTNIGLFHNHATSPEGVTNATKLYPASSGSARYMYNATSGASSIYTISAYVKADGKNVAWLYIDSIAAQGVVYFDLSDASKQEVNGTSNTITGDIEDAGNGWYRISATIGTALAISSASGIGVSDAKGSLNVTANGTDGILVYGLQIEAGSYKSSYIPTYGSASGRAADVCNKTSVPSLIGTTESSIFLDVVLNGFSNTAGAVFALLLEANSGSERAQIVFNSTKSLSVTLRDNSVDVAVVATSSNYLVTGTRYKIGVTYSLSGLSVYVNGSLLGTDSVPSLPTLQDIYINDYKTSGLYQGAIDVNQVLLFKQALTNAELAALTA